MHGERLLALSPVLLLISAACGSSGDCTPTPVLRTLLDTDGIVTAGEEVLHVANKPSDANIIHVGLDWDGAAVLQLRAESVACVCGVCELLPGDPRYSEVGLGDFKLILEGDFSCTDAFDITVVGDAEVPADYQLVVLYETAGCAT
jgi:hypothetical protein